MMDDEMMHGSCISGIMGMFMFDDAFYGVLAHLQEIPSDSIAFELCLEILADFLKYKYLSVRRRIILILAIERFTSASRNRME